MRYEETIYVEKEILDGYKALLNGVMDPGSKPLGENESLTYAAVFENGMEMQINIRDIAYGSNECDPWTEAVLFDAGTEVASTGVCEDLEGDWRLDYDGDTYIVHVRENPCITINWSITGKHGKKQSCTMAACKIMKEHFHGFEICLPDGRCLKIGYEDNETACRISLFDPEAAEAEGRQDIAETAEICGNFILLHP